MGKGESRNKVSTSNSYTDHRLNYNSFLEQRYSKVLHLVSWLVGDS